jgi:crotonobetainyl-CoA:carnitine CoA-transferase CaiB-like acyl-CoA transferase
VRVVDLSALLPGPMTTRVLADLGANVIKVEPPRGDGIREYMPGVYEWLNRGKRVFRVDLKRPEGLDAVLALIERADVVLEGFRPGVAARLGVGYEAVAGRRPDIVYCSISSHGQDGPDRDRPGHNIGFEASGGAYAGLLAHGVTPAASPTPLADTGGALFAATTICAQLAGRARRGEAAGGPLMLDVSLEEVVAFLSAPRWGTFLTTGRPPAPGESAHAAPGMGIFATADGRYVALAAVEDPLWRATCAALERPDLDAAPYNTHAGRMEHAAELRPLLAAAIGALRATALLARADAHGMPVELARTLDEVAANPHLVARRALRALHAGVGPEIPVRVGAERSFAGDRQPDPEADTAAILAELATAVPAAGGSR